MASLELRNVHKSYGNSQIATLKDIALKIDAGEFLILVGPSGCGKSTLMNCIAGLENITGGEILVDGDRCTPLLLDHDGVAYHPLHSGGALDSVTIEQIRPALEAAGIPVSGARLTLSMILRASEMLVVGSGMGIRAVGTIDGRTIGRPQGRLFQVAWESWLTRLESGWVTAEDL